MPPERARPLPPELVGVISSYLHDTDETLRHCYACETKSATRISFEPISELAPSQLESIHGTRCDACGDVRLYQLLKDGTVEAAIRAELDELAWILTETCSEGLSHGRH